MRKKQKAVIISTLQSKYSYNRKEIIREVLINFAYLIAKSILILTIFFIIFNFIYGIKRVKSNSMSPRMKNGDLVLYYRLDDQISAGDVVLINKNNHNYILRIVGLPNDELKLSEDNKLMVNNREEITQVFYETTPNKKSNIKFPYKVGNNEYFVMGDYRKNTNDSRTFGTITKKDIKGKIIGNMQVRNI